MDCGVRGGAGAVSSRPAPRRRCEEDRELGRVESLAEDLGRGTAADLFSDHERSGGVARGLEVFLKEPPDHRGRSRFLLGGLADERAAVEGFHDGRVLALGVNLLLQLGIAAQGLGVFLLPGFALLVQGLLDLPLLGQGSEPFGLLGFEGRLLALLELFELLLQRPQPLVLLDRQGDVGGTGDAAARAGLWASEVGVRPARREGEFEGLVVD